ncbi:hypothetical protein CANTEDRAFT_124743 [Yamadazyma tenuis ATCC 10573]|uniref:C2H2-type domain-containing protein n=1 Tax=Candida tenuis (strain ATCC 10573 / BCRC 21748 / CBS 615 / JCM 9827 / NBRC 10315 / NRRL Y-1498 / VKM Y-70) TaxID=590646 RepID=G3B892_CANTC|nr:uncharacterized protein CANTEDRAFT_124743 [Yamadazyma tenuis ATCC 10573]EGV61717.1 hypothetical protein CANTEDRAFT_124743 [Yamadazyma tenuis ATCC 10573]
MTRYVCDIVNCKKSFTRADHLARHRLNHESGSRHRCEWPNCGKTFVRNDVYKKHYREQHEHKSEKTEKISKPSSKPIRFVFMDESKLPKMEPEETNSISPLLNNSSYTQIETPTLSPFTPVDSQEDMNQNIDPANLSINELVSSDELIRWLFGGIENNSDSSSANEPEIPHFPFSNEQTVIDQSIMEGLEDALPSIKFQEDFKGESLQYYLEIYWKYYHPQFPILNKPSFSTRKSHPILILSMITIGAYLSSTLKSDSSRKGRFFSESIAVPLRWAIYKSKEFKPPPKLWVVQSLVLLQTNEICCSSRDLHERANLHRGLSIQMLKRSPMFGGNPWVKPSVNSGENYQKDATIPPYSSQEHWDKWIEDESMKRCALATFYLETLHAVVFGHDMVIDLHDVKPTLPCNEHFWRTGRYSENCLQKPLTLLAAIKSILHKKPVKTRGFGKRIILSGLIALSFEVKDREFEFSISELKSVKQLWQSNIDEAFKFWDLNCSLSAQKNVSPRIWSETYSIPLRELYESYTQMKHYDFMVYAGAPGRMNVEFNEKEVELVTSRIVDWTNSIQGKRAVVLIYSYFCNLLFAGENQEPHNYDPKEDRCFYRKQMISHMLSILWCYNFHSCGPESHDFRWNSENPDHIPSKEDGHAHLQRVKAELTMLAGKPFTTENIYEDVELFAGVLDSVSGRGNMVGLFRIFKTEYLSDSSEIVREHSRLLENCINRSLGSSSIFCSNMFE